MGGGSKAVTIGYKYYLGLHMVLCHGPVDAITGIVVDGRDAWTGSNTGGRITVSADNLFGGTAREGGVSGEVDIAMGEATQLPNDYLQTHLGEIPAYRGVVSAILRQVYVGMNPYIKKWAFWATRRFIKTDGTAQWYSTKVAVGDDMNPAHIIRECLTDRDWGMGYPEADIDATSFTAAADALHAEGFGMSLLWDRAMTIEEFLKQVLSHIAGSLYVSRDTGLFTLKLSRSDYVASELLLLDESKITKISDFKRGLMPDLVNSVTVVYWDASTGNKSSVTVQDIALVSRQLTTVGTTKQFPGITNGALAVRLAERELAALSTPLLAATLYATRAAAGLNVGDPFRMSWPQYGVEEVVMRVTNVELGTLEAGTVKLTCVEDIYALGDATYAAPAPTNWVDPIVEPTPSASRYVVEASYRDLLLAVGSANAQTASVTSGVLLAAAREPSAGALNASLYTSPFGTYERVGVVDFCPVAELGTGVNKTDTIWTLALQDRTSDVRLGTVAAIGTELVRVDSLSSGSITVGRGVLDTVPQDHSAGAVIYFLDDYSDSDEIEYSTADTAYVKFCPVTGKGELAIASAPADPVTFDSRHARPYPPGQFLISSQSYPAEVTGSISVDWVHRDRLGQEDQLLSTTAGSMGPEAGTTYSLALRRVDTQAILDSTTGLTGTSHALGAAYEGDVQVELWSVRDGLASWQKHTHILNLIAAAMNVRPVHRATIHQGITASGSSTIDMPTGTVEGDLLVMMIACNSSGTPSAPAGWTEFMPSYTSGSVLTRGYWKIAGAAETAVSISATARCAWALYAIEMGTFDPVTPIDTTVQTSQGTSANAGVPAGSASYGGGSYIQVQIAAYDNAATPSGVTYPFAYGSWRAAGVSTFTNIVHSLGDFNGNSVTPASTFVLPVSDSWQSRKFIIRGNSI